MQESRANAKFPGEKAFTGTFAVLCVFTVKMPLNAVFGSRTNWAGGEENGLPLAKGLPGQVTTKTPKITKTKKTQNNAKSVQNQQKWPVEMF